jgi:hypothetical protein
MIFRRHVVQVIAAGTFTVWAATAASAADDRKYKPPHNEFGQVDLQGTWNNATITPLERPPQYGDKRAFTEAEAKAIEQKEQEFIERSTKATDASVKVEDLDKLPNQCRSGSTGAMCGYNSFWTDMGYGVVRVQGEARTSILTEPANGRLPPPTPAAAQARQARMAARGRGGNFDGPEARSLGERCLMSFGSSAGPPMLPLMYNNNYQIVQTKDHVMILVEMVHDVRVIRLNAKHAPAALKRWMGDSIGHYEGDSLIVETININPVQTFRGGSAEQKITEKFTRVAPGRIEYEFRIEDPASTAPYGGALNFNATNDSVYEYACHEGNYALAGILAGAREEERAAEKAKAANK